MPSLLAAKTSAVQEIFSGHWTHWLMIYHQTKFGCKRLISSEDSQNSHSLTVQALLLWSWHLTVATIFFSFLSFFVVVIFCLLWVVVCLGILLLLLLAFVVVCLFVCLCVCVCVCACVRAKGWVVQKISSGPSLNTQKDRQDRWTWPFQYICSLTLLWGYKTYTLSNLVMGV